MSGPLQLGPWTLGKCIYSGAKKEIYEATSDIAGSWLIKLRPNDSISELTNLLAMEQLTIKNMVATPEAPYYKFGITQTSVWFAMKRYDGHITQAHKGSWRTIGRACIQFLKELHKNCGRNYLDFRPENILVDGDKFIVADYELMNDGIGVIKTRDYDKNNRWYFMARGAEPDECLNSWRMDFTGLGYMLTLLIAEKEPAFVTKFIDRRFECKGRPNHKSMKQLAAQRNAVIYKLANPTMKTYFDIIGKIDWDNQPLYAVYDELEALFTGGECDAV